MAATRHVIFAAVALLLAAGAVFARPLTDAERRSLEATVAAFDEAMRVKDYEAVVKIIPPRVMEHMAGQAGVDADALRAVIVEQMNAMLDEVKLLSFGMDVANARQQELPNGEPYALIPTETVIDAGSAGKFRTRSDTLALLDGGTWYLLRVSEEEQVAIMRQVYPEFAGIEFSAGSTEATE